MITDIINNKSLSLIVTELLIKGIKLNNSTVFTTQSYFQVLGCWDKLYTFFIIKTANKQDLQQIAFNHLSDIGLEDFMKLYKNRFAEPYSFLVIDTAFSD